MTEEKKIRRKMHDKLREWDYHYRQLLAVETGLSRSLVNFYFQGFGENPKIIAAADAMLVLATAELAERERLEERRKAARAQLLPAD